MLIKRMRNQYPKGRRFYYIHNFGYRFTYHRLRLDLTMDQLAELVGINASYLFKLQKGTIEPIGQLTINKLTRVLGDLTVPVPNEPPINPNDPDLTPPTLAELEEYVVQA